MNIVKKSERFLIKKNILYKREGIKDFKLNMGGGVFASWNVF